ncbi:hypothetical protein FRC17_003347 [Serendipita sp. 399]|nr:hypothetical protein FRC17_003347 [Serendipita sp. 399]
MWLTKTPVTTTLATAKEVVDTYKKSRVIWKRSELGASGILHDHYESAKRFIKIAEKIVEEQGEDGSRALDDVEGKKARGPGIAWPSPQHSNWV